MTNQDSKTGEREAFEEDDEEFDCGHDWDMSCPPCRVCGGCPECGDCDCGIDDSDDFYDDSEDDTIKDGYA
jgi:hypothetical protein